MSDVNISSDQTPVPIANKATSISVTPTLSTSPAYTSGDALATVMEFTNAVRTTGGSGVIEKLVVTDNDVQSAAGELWLFNATVTGAAANAPHYITDADAALSIGVIPFGPYYASASNSVSVAKGQNLAFTVTGTSLFGIPVTRGTPTHTAAGLVFKLHISQD